MSDKKTDVIKLENHGDNIPVSFNTSYESLGSKFDELDSKTPAINIISEYWGGDSGAEIGETRRSFFLGVKEQVDQNGELIEIVEFVYRKDGTPKVYRNASSLLVGVMKKEGFPVGSPFDITYDGKKANKEGRKYDVWAVKPLI